MLTKVKSVVRSTGSTIKEHRGKLAAGATAVVVGTVAFTLMRGQDQVFTRFLNEKNLLEDWHKYLYTPED